jgi:NAD(P)-dependent dehydrogenase (short-subunit alcohol dehydrogenase family)
MNLGIAGRTALVMGGSKGIGFEVARLLAAEEAKVAIVARTQKHIDRTVGDITAAGGVAFGVSADMSAREGIDQAVAEVTDHYAAPDIVVTQADFHVRGFFEEIEDREAFVESYRVYTMSQVHMPTRCSRR